MNDLRLFIALEIPPAFIKEIAALIKQLKTYKPDIKWTNQDNQHLTLVFLGNTPKDRVFEIKAVINETALKHKPIKVRLKRQLYHFGLPKKPKVLWLGFDDVENQLIEIQQALAGKLRACGCEIEKRKYIPHLTLGRFRSAKNSHFLKKNIIFDNLADALIDFNEIMLYKSQISAEGAIHTMLHSAQLKD
jgi:2'-5' RNA ligase